MTKYLEQLVRRHYHIRGRERSLLQFLPALISAMSAVQRRVEESRGVTSPLLGMAHIVSGFARLVFTVQSHSHPQSNPSRLDPRNSSPNGARFDCVQGQAGGAGRTFR